VYCVFPLQRLGERIPFNELLDWHRSSIMALDSVLKTVEYGVRISSSVGPFKYERL
jgi:hypothetical protein